MKKALFLFSASFLFNVVNACLNEYHVSKTGVETIDHFYMGHLVFVRDFDIIKLNKELEILLRDTSTKEDDILYNKNNIAVKYIKLGKINEAKALLEQLLKDHPGEYNVNVNLGTLYELMGENNKALGYIKKAMSINTESHRGSEWFHVKVLEYKLKNRTDSQIPGEVILSLNKSGFDAQDMAQDVAYQLQERIPFTPTPNLMMAKILMEYGDYLADSISVKAAYVMYGIAQEYDPANILPLEIRKKELEPIFKKFKKKVKIPDHKDYFVSGKEAGEQNATNKEVANLLEQGVKKIFSDETKAESSFWTGNKGLYIFGGAIVLVIMAVLFFRFRRKN